MAAYLTGKVYALSDLLCRRDEDFDDLCNVLLQSDLADLQAMTMKMEEQTVIDRTGLRWKVIRISIIRALRPGIINVQELIIQV